MAPNTSIILTSVTVGIVGWFLGRFTNDKTKEDLQKATKSTTDAKAKALEDEVARLKDENEKLTEAFNKLNNDLKAALERAAMAEAEAVKTKQAQAQAKPVVAATAASSSKASPKVKGIWSGKK